MSLHGVASDRVYIVKPMFPWAGWALTPPFHPYVVDSRIQIVHIPASRKLTLYAESPLPIEPACAGLRWGPRGADAVYLCCTCPGVTPGGRYPLSLPCGARTFLIWNLSVTIRGCPTWSRKYCTANKPKCQMSCKFFSYTIYYKLNNCHCEPVRTLAWQSPSTLQKSGGDCHVASLLAMTLNLKK